MRFRRVDWRSESAGLGPKKDDMVGDKQMEGRQHKMSIHCLCLCAFILYYEHKYMDNCTSNSLKILSSRPLGNCPTVQHSRSFVLPAVYSEAKEARFEA